MAHELKLLLLLSDEVGVAQARDRERRLVGEEIQRGRENVLREIYKGLGRELEGDAEEIAMDKTTGAESSVKDEKYQGAKDGEDVMEIASEERPQPSSPASPPDAVPQLTRGALEEEQEVKKEEVMEVDDDENEDDDGFDIVEVHNNSNLASSAPASVSASAPEVPTIIKDDSEEDDDFEEIF